MSWNKNKSRNKNKKMVIQETKSRNKSRNKNKKMVIQETKKKKTVTIRRIKIRKKINIL